MRYCRRQFLSSIPLLLARRRGKRERGPPYTLVWFNRRYDIDGLQITDWKEGSVRD